MKIITSLALLLLAACASSTGIIDSRVFRCGESGQAIEVRAALADPSRMREDVGPLQYIIEVANNSHQDVTVTSIRVTPRADNAAGLDSVYRTYDQLIPEGTDHLFEIPASEVWVRGSEFDRRIAGRRIEFEVMVLLSNGDSYRCSFASR